jgi:hypothetical protein
MHSRILAIDLRSQLFGFAVFEGPQTLLSFGRRLLSVGKIPNNAVIVRKKIVRLTTFFAPSLIVLKHTSGRNDRELLKRKDAIAVIREEAELRSVELVLLNRREIYRAFQQSSNTSKQKIAGLIADIFPEVAWKLPPHRKNWEPEHHNMAIFDAISVGLTYFIQSGQMLEGTWEQSNQ